MWKFTKPWTILNILFPDNQKRGLRYFIWNKKNHVLSTKKCKVSTTLYSPETTINNKYTYKLMHIFNVEYINYYGTNVLYYTP